MSHTILHIDASARHDGSVSRALSERIVQRLAPAHTIRRDLGEDPLPQVGEAWVDANDTPVDQHSDAQRAAMALSDQLIDEIRAADTIVIGTPVYNFNLPASLKAWIDQIVRSGVTFEYTDSETGPRGLLPNRRVIVAMASGGTPLGSGMDHASPYLRHILGFVGLTDIEFVSAHNLAFDAENALAEAESAADRIAA